MYYILVLDSRETAACTQVPDDMPLPVKTRSSVSIKYSCTIIIKNNNNNRGNNISKKHLFDN